MSQFKIIFCSLCLWYSTTIFAESGQAYLDKFLTYTNWSQNLPTSPTPDFDTFIANTTPLAKKLREKWLYHLAQNKNWVLYSQYYRDSNDTNLQCYAQLATYHQGKASEALSGAIPLWLNGSSQPKACDALFNLLLQDKAISDDLIRQRIALALEKNNLSLARHLLKQLNPAHLEDAELLSSIHQNPTRITQLQPNTLHGEFYLYGLKQIIPHDMPKAIILGNSVRAKQIMTEAQHQTFLAQIALYQAMRNQPDTLYWFNKIKPAYYNDILLEWTIRFALTQYNWHQVLLVAQHIKNKDEPCWQYWMARAHDALGEHEQALQLYKKLAEKRNYYGFLASARLKQKMQFENELAVNNTQVLAVYKPIIDQIKTLYQTHQQASASRLLNDFSSELPKSEKSALAYWVNHDLNWHGKSINLSNNEELNNQLSLRFPLAYQQTVKEYAHNYQIPPAFIYAVIRQESAFNDGIVSSAGANGLMQLMPLTAKVVAKRARIPYSDYKQLFKAQTNIHIGSAYLQLLSHQFGQHPVLMAAAYNAGPKQVRYWIKNHPPKEIDIWIETLPWKETRNYLKNIIAFYAVYQYRMQEKASLKLFMRPFRDS